MIKVLVVDDSALMRNILSTLIGEAPDMEVVGTAPNPLAAREMIKSLNPDVLTLDVEMPQMDGISFLEKIMTLRPMPVVMVSSLTQAGADTTIRALELGAVDFVAKPALDLRNRMVDLRDELTSKVRAAAKVHVRPIKLHDKKTATVAKYISSSEKIVVIGASTGGVEALSEIIQNLPENAPAVLIAQHMPEKFTGSFAKRMNSLARVQVSEAEDGARILPGHVYIAPGNYHLRLKKSGADYRCTLDSGPLVSGHRPSVDVLFESVANVAGANAIGVILTGMGRDGAEGLLKMRENGAMTFGQDEQSSLVYGMPKAAQLLGAVVTELPLSNMVREILAACQKKKRAVRI